MLDFKTGRGGLMEAEFCVQALQMQHGVWEQNSIAAIAELARRGILPQDRATGLRDAWLFLRRVEAVLRRAENSSVSTLPPEELEQRRLAIRTGFENRQTLMERYIEARETIHGIARGIW
jgi:glutamate-ammonia-ligase adenylyltransferase